MGNSAEGQLCNWWVTGKLLVGNWWGIQLEDSYVTGEQQAGNWWVTGGVTGR